MLNSHINWRKEVCHFFETKNLNFLFRRRRHHCCRPCHHHQSILPKGRSFTANAGTKFAVLSKGRSSTANSGTKVAVLLGINRCGGFPLLSALHSLFSFWTDLKRSEKIPGPQHGVQKTGFGWLGPLDFTKLHHRG